MLSKRDKSQAAIVKRVWRRRGDEGHGSAWKVAFADFCLALLALFLVMWLLAAREQERLEALLEAHSMIDEGIGRMPITLGGPRGSMIGRELSTGGGAVLVDDALAVGEDPTPAVRMRLSRTLFESSADLHELAQILQAIGDRAGLTGNVRTMVTPYGLRVLLHDTDKRGMFAVGGATPTAHFRELLQQLGPLFSTVRNQMLIVGHTDALPYVNRGPGGASNWKLSSERAMAARTWLLAGGMPETSVLQVVGLADSAPLNRDNPRAAENRRIELLILTSGQAHLIKAMFGAPTDSEPLLDGVSTSIPDYGALQALRMQIATDARSSDGSL
ncbi:MAG TPA: flagellar motor protein MotB [Steroidobacter sp.]|nr:flagellar motor protein MotB [Steroidobacteraceae bacterium]HLS81610.1 flagellar motor protein MotB [Steroidobacter sp.]